MEQTTQCASIELARNAAIAWLESKGAVFGPDVKIAIGRLGMFAGSEVGVEAKSKPWWRLRIDYDDKKGLHFNAGVADGPEPRKMAFCFPGTEKMKRALVNDRKPR